MLTMLSNPLRENCKESCAESMLVMCISKVTVRLWDGATRVEASLLKMLYLSVIDITKKWTGRRRDWRQTHSQLGGIAFPWFPAQQKILLYLMPIMGFTQIVGIHPDSYKIFSRPV